MIIAFGIGGVEILSIIARQLNLTGGFWSAVTNLDFGFIGVGIIVVFLGSWAISTLIYRWRGYDDLLLQPAVAGSELEATAACPHRAQARRRHRS